MGTQPVQYPRLAPSPQKVVLGFMLCCHRREVFSFQLEALHFHFALGSINYVARPVQSFGSTNKFWVVNKCHLEKAS